MQLIEIDHLNRPPQGDELSQLISQMKGLQDMRAVLDSEYTLYLSTEEGKTFGKLLKAESAEPKKRFLDEIAKRIEQVKKEIVRRTDALV